MIEVSSRSSVIRFIISSFVIGRRSVICREGGAHALGRTFVGDVVERNASGW